MGFGYGQKTSHGVTARDLATGARVASRFDNAMTAHVWAQLSQSFGQSGNGNIYFEGRALYSYGTHYVAGYIMPNAESADGSGRGVALVNGERHSVTTSGHTSDARRAVRGRYHDVPNLNRFAAIFRRALCYSPCGPEGGPVRADLNRATVRRDVAAFRKVGVAELRDYLATPEAWGEAFAARPAPESCSLSLGAAADMFAAFGVADPQRAAEVARRKAKATFDKATAAEAAKEKAAALYTAGIYARPDVLPRDLARLESARRNMGKGRTWRGMAEQAARPFAEEARDALRAAKVAKAAGRVRVAAMGRAYHKAILTALRAFPEQEERALSRDTWQERKGVFRAGVAAFHALARGESPDPRRLSEGVNAARLMVAALGNDGTGWATRAARVAGVNPDALKTALTAAANAMADKVDSARIAEVRAKVRADVAAVRAGRRALADLGDLSAFREAARLAAEAAGTPEGLAAAMAAHDSAVALRAVVTAARNVADAKANTGRNRWNSESIARPWRVAGFTAATFRAEADKLDSARAALNGALSYLADPLRAANLARAADLWRAGQPMPEGVNAYQVRDAEGGPLLRAEGVTRDAAGNVTGGTLRTSQGAEVPLTHALRVFRFLRLVRASGEAWERNGRVVRVGHFTVDAVDAEGNFRAGCHAIRFAEVARLADALGVADLAPADAREPSGAVHA